jgi:Spy/CpxP family protein refolding chaperone
LESLGLSEEQRSSIERIENHYNDQILGLRSELMSRRFELQSAFRNPQADERQVRGRAREVMDLHNKCLAMMIDYQMEIRAILTPEQLRLWCASTDSCFVKGWSKEP